jgi:RsmE family RNA methyltransferase
MLVQTSHVDLLGEETDSMIDAATRRHSVDPRDRKAVLLSPSPAMNLLLLRPSDLDAEDRAEIRDERVDHVRRILGARPGDDLCVGRLGGPLGRGRIEALDREHLVLRVTWTGPPPPASATTLVLALPRPKFLGRILQSATEIGVKEIVLLGTRRVEKSYWSSSVLEPAAIERQLRLGLEQGRDTILPEVVLVRRFRAFLEERLPSLLERGELLVAHAEGSDVFPPDTAAVAGVVVGPEGGLLDHEAEALAARGARMVSLGPRALRVETAVSVVLGRLL